MLQFHGTPQLPYDWEIIKRVDFPQSSWETPTSDPVEQAHLLVGLLTPFLGGME